MKLILDDMTEESQEELLQALEEDSSHLLSELLHLTSSEELILRSVNALLIFFKNRRLMA